MIVSLGYAIVSLVIHVISLKQALSSFINAALISLEILLQAFLYTQLYSQFIRRGLSFAHQLPIIHF